MAKERTRLPVNELTAQDFEFSPCWAYASDEEGQPDQDECTVRPLDIAVLRSVKHQVLVQALFIFPNGRARLGMVTLNAGHDVESHQPALFTSSGLASFYAGASPPSSAEVAEMRSVLRQVSRSPWPVRYISVLHTEDGEPLATGLLQGIYWLANWRTGEMRVKA
ncbi:hypothetical protein H5407_00230 [Mitsuaria sp. WAJ17]|uniref:hypothetical protein n=1 Tax=Mitsuaria sp. WAJ17 TaxID=2761452 RepID=UPI001602D628|nr:hypothetical protein [Mitsuaria sp. WAJ17]MBB2483644.1 hypothetical protein [Mitsuaria sp. WAJ17]